MTDASLAMSGATVSTCVEYAPLARELLRQAVVAFAAVAAEERGPALAAIDGFLATPGPASYLAATRVLATVQREGSLQKVRAAQARYLFGRGLETAQRELGSAAAEVLAAIPLDERAGHRLRALALLAAAHRELAERVAGSAELLLKQLERAHERSPQKAPVRRRPAQLPRRRVSS